MNQLANLLTILSLFSGFLSIFLSFSGQFTFAAYAVILSVCLDGFDGYVARSAKVSSEFGRELDSLVDAVSFGVAPVLLGQAFIYKDLYQFAIAVLFIYLVCAVVRLARYNISTKGMQDNYFHGLPTTISGGLLASFVLIHRKANFPAGSATTFFIFLVLLLSFLMVSQVCYLNLKGLRQALGEVLKPVLISLFIILCVALCRDKLGVALFSVLLIYLIFSPFVVKRLNNA